MYKKNINIIVTGPTSCGKSRCSMDIANSIKGEIVNSDSMQIYKELSEITARPNKIDYNQIIHHLYGYITFTQQYSVAQWLIDSHHILESIHSKKITPIITGGSGLYIDALINGISHVPDIDHKTKKYVKELMLSNPKSGFMILKEKDPAIIPNINPQDTYRITRALEVILSTGKSLLYWNSQSKDNTLNHNFIVIHINPDRSVVQENAKKRLHTMFNNGAIAEVKTLLEKNPDQSNNIMKAIGVNEIKLYLENKTSLQEAFDNSFISTRQYIKRQQTWFKKYLKPDITINNCYSNSDLQPILEKINSYNKDN